MRRAITVVRGRPLAAEFPTGDGIRRLAVEMKGAAMIELCESEGLKKEQTCERIRAERAPKWQCSNTKSDHRIQRKVIDRPRSRRPRPTSCKTI
jgi:hypothetical protein